MAAAAHQPGTCVACQHPYDLMWTWYLLDGAFSYELVCVDAKACRDRLTARRLIASAVGE